MLSSVTDHHIHSLSLSIFYFINFGSEGDEGFLFSLKCKNRFFWFFVSNLMKFSDTTPSWYDGIDEPDRMVLSWTPQGGVPDRYGPKNRFQKVVWVCINANSFQTCTFKKLFSLGCWVRQLEELIRFWDVGSIWQFRKNGFLMFSQEFD